MFLKEKSSRHLVEVLNLTALFDPLQPRFEGRYNHGQDVPDPELFDKAGVAFPSGEELPRCWLDTHYRDNELRH